MTQSRIYGYACEDVNVPPVEKMVAAITAKAEHVDGEWARCQVEFSNLAAVAWRERPGLGLVLQEIHRGDHLVIHSLDQLAPAAIPIVEAVEYLVDHGIVIHVLDFEGESIDLEGSAAKWFVKLMRGLLAWYAHARSRSMIRIKQRCREAGRLLPGAPPPGRRRIKSRGVKLDVWDSDQCDIVREIKGRRDAGETFNSIACDFARRKLKRGDGKLLAWFTKGKTRAHVTYIHRIYHWYEKLLREGKQLEA